MTSPVIYAAAYLLIAAPAPAHIQVVRPLTQPQAIKLLDCLQPNHLTIRWVGDRHHHHRHDARGHHPR
jgi:hypothetical protein